MRSASESPWPWYFFATETTKRRLARTSLWSATWSPCLIRRASSTSSSGVSRGTCPISWRYWSSIRWERGTYMGVAAGSGGIKKAGGPRRGRSAPRRPSRVRARAAEGGAYDLGLRKVLSTARASRMAPAAGGAWPRPLRRFLPEPPRGRGTGGGIAVHRLPIQRLREVGPQILRRLQPDGHPQQPGRDAARGARGVADDALREAGGVLDEGVHRTEADGGGDEPEP